MKRISIIMEDRNDQRDENSFTVNLFLLWDLVSDMITQSSPTAAGLSLGSVSPYTIA
jgi:hypothetical protein